MNRDLTHLLYILECIEKVEKATKAKTVRSFANSGIIKDGVLYNLQTMAESTQKVSKSLKLMESEIPWSEIGDFRNKLVHDYLGIDLEIVWRVIKKELPKLKRRVTRMIDFLKKKERS